MPTPVINRPNSNGIGIFQPFPPDGVLKETVGNTLQMQKSYPVKGGSLGPNGSLKVEVQGEYTDNANNKEVQVRLVGVGGSFTFGQSVGANVESFSLSARFHNQNSESAQKGYSNSSSGFGQVASSKFIGAIDTSQDFAIEIWQAAFTAPDFARVDGVVATAWQG